jgi:hypothetical protein
MMVDFVEHRRQYALSYSIFLWNLLSHSFLAYSNSYMC